MPYKNKEEQKRFQREWCAKRRHDFLKDKDCTNCHTKEKLELHHIDPKQKISHHVWSWSETKRLKEIAKCEVLCETCHKDKHKELRQNVGDAGHN